jgi:predicted kinase
LIEFLDPIARKEEDSMKQSYVYILCGLPFAGKTTLAKELVHWLGIKRVAIDEINSERGIWNDETGMSSEEWTKTYQEAYQRIAAFLSQSESVVDDSANFTREQRNRLRAIAKQYNAQTCVLFVDIPLSEARCRWQENRQTAVRADVRDDDFAYVIEYFDPPGEDENVLRYDGSLPPKEWTRLRFSKKESRHKA